jgi:hypothetical protein
VASSILEVGTSFADKQRSLGRIVRSRTQAREFRIFNFSFYRLETINENVSWITKDQWQALLVIKNKRISLLSERLICITVSKRILPRGFIFVYKVLTLIFRDDSLCLEDEGY